MDEMYLFHPNGFNALKLKTLKQKRKTFVRKGMGDEARKIFF